MQHTNIIIDLPWKSGTRLFSFAVVETTLAKGVNSKYVIKHVTAKERSSSEPIDIKS